MNDTTTIPTPDPAYVRLPSGTYVQSPSSVDRWNRVIVDVFRMRHGRDFDPDEPGDVERRNVIVEWELDDCPLPGETEDERRRRGAHRGEAELAEKMAAEAAERWRAVGWWRRWRLGR